MNDQFRNLGWSEATIFDLSFVDGELKFKMHDILSYDDPLKYEIVEIEICQIEALRVETIPFRYGRYGDPKLNVAIGKLEIESDGFEGVLLSNPFSESVAEHWWVGGDFHANEILIYRTGEFVYIPLKK